MFDVIWTDPDRQLVGEHRAKKETAREQQKARDKLEGKRSSPPTRGSASSGEKSYGFFGSRSLKKAAGPRRAKRPSTPTSYADRTPTADDGQRRHARHQWNLNTAPSMPTLRPSSNHSSEAAFSQCDPFFENGDASYPSSSRGKSHDYLAR